MRRRGGRTMVVLHPPIWAAPFKKFKLASTGREVSPPTSAVAAPSTSMKLRPSSWPAKAGSASPARPRPDDLRKIAKLDAARVGIRLRPLVSMRDRDLRAAAAFCAARHQRSARNR